MARPEYHVLCRESALIAVESLTTSPHPQAAPLACMILDALPESINGGASIRLPAIPDDMHALLLRCNVRTGLVTSVRHPRYVAVYRHPEDPTVPDITVRTFDRPRSRRTLRGPGGRRRYVRVSFHRMTKEELPMAARQTRTRAKSRKATKPAEELDDLEALEELEDLEDIEEEAPAKPARRSRSKAKPAPEPEPEDEDDEDADEDGDEYDDMNTAELRAACKEAGIKSRGLNADAMREALREESDDDADDEEDEEEDEAPAPKRRTKATTKPTPKAATKKGTTTKRTPPAPRAVPAGKFSVNDIAEAVGTSGLNVRQWLRRNEIEKDDETGRYIFGKKEFDRIVKKMSA